MRRALIAITACVLLTARAPEAFGQCSISRLEINGVVTLCADNGDAWEWTGPGGFTSSAMCIDALVEGTYSLRVFDAASGTWSAPCSEMVGTPPPTGPTCSITGPDTVCAGGMAGWCAPTGDLDYLWTGPNGWTAYTSCVNLSVGGVYTLTLTDRTTGAKSQPCSKTLVVKDCAPPPTPEDPMCPASARWWSHGCDSHDSSVPPDVFARLSQMVDERSALWAFEGDPEGLCELLTARRHGRSIRSARRQFAAVHSNLCARELGVRDAGGRLVGLDPDMTLDEVEGVAPGTTLRDWVQAAEASLIAMGDGRRRDRAIRAEVRRIREQARDINAGSRQSNCAGSTRAGMDDDDDDDDDFGGPEAWASFSGGSNPFGGGKSLQWTLERSGEVQLDVIDLSGRRVRRLASGVYAAGTHEFAWDGRDDGGRALHAGAYFVAGRVGDQRVAQRLILLR